MNMIPTEISTDYHCHLLPCLDDGPATVEESLEMAAALSDAGFSTVCCTPHLIRGVYNTTPGQVRSATAQLQEMLLARALPLTLVPACEYCLDEFFLDSLTDPLLLPGNLLLVEIPPRSNELFVAETLFQLASRGIAPLIAHPERCDLLRDEGDSGKRGALLSLFNRKAQPAKTSLMTSLLSMGCKFQGNLGSFGGLYGDKVRRQAEMFQAAGVYSHYGSDLHTIRHKWILSGRVKL